MRILLFSLLLCAMLLFAYRRGGQPEKVVAATLVLAFALGLLILVVMGPSDYLQFDPVRFSLESVVLLVLMVVAIRANRWWPICVSGLQLIIVTTQMLKLVGIRGSFGIYWAMTTVPTYFQYLLLLIGVVAHTARANSVGTYRDWRRV